MALTGGERGNGLGAIKISDRQKQTLSSLGADKLFAIRVDGDIKKSGKISRGSAFERTDGFG